MLKRKEKIDIYKIPSIRTFREKLRMRIDDPDDNFDINERTLHNYCYHSYLTLRDMGIPFDQKPTIEAIKKWRNEVNKEYAPYTLNIKATAINHFLKLIWDMDYKMRRPKKPTVVKESKPLDKETVMAMFEYYKREKKYTWAYAILSQFELCCRSNSLLDIQMEDIKVEDQEIFLRTMKYGYTQNVIVSPEYLQQIQEYKDNYRPEPTLEEDKDILFIYEDGKRLKYTSYNWAIKRVATNFGIETDVHSHIFRHSGITHLKRNVGMDWTDIRHHVTGHKTEGGMESYKHSLSKDKVKKIRGNSNNNNHNDKSHTEAHRQQQKGQDEELCQNNSDEHSNNTNNAEYSFTIDGNNPCFTIFSTYVKTVT